MSGPARVANADISRDRFGFQKPRKTFTDFSLFLADEQHVAAHHSHACAVVAAIFQPPQPFQQDGRSRLFTDVSNYAAHKINLKVYTSYLLYDVDAKFAHALYNQQSNYSFLYNL